MAKKDLVEPESYLDNLQLVLYFKEPYSDLDKAADYISSEFRKGEEDFWNVPTLLSTPEAPPEFPRIITESKDSKFNLNISKDRISLNYFNSDPSQIKITGYESVPQKAKLIFKDLFNKFEFTNQDYQRMGFVAVLVFPEKDPTLTIKEKYFKNEVLNEPTEIFLRFNNKELLDNSIQINKNITIGNGMLIYPKEKREIKTVNIRIDVNSVIDHTKIVTKETFLKIISRAEDFFTHSNVKQLIHDKP